MIETRSRTPSRLVDLAESFPATKVSLEALGHGPTGWSKAWKISLYGRLFEADKAYEILTDLVSAKTYGNLWIQSFD